jgi:photosystem II stability/assembly factor-like uncharacterized protein
VGSASQGSAILYVFRAMRNPRVFKPIGGIAVGMTLFWATGCSGAAQPPVSTPGPAVAITVAPDDLGTLWTSTRSGVYRSRDGGDTWRRVPGAPGDTSASFARKRMVLVGGGDAWTGSFTGVGLRPMANPPADLIALSSPFYQTNRLYALDSAGRLWVTVTGGRRWSPVRASGLPAGAVALSARRAATDQPDWIFVAAGPAGLWRSHDFGASFHRLPGIGDATAVATTPHDATRVLVAGPTGLWLSTDNGGSFRKVLDRRGITAVALDTRNWKNGYATLDDGRMLRSDDGGDTWGVPR